jgi:hypothetical protein
MYSPGIFLQGLRERMKTLKPEKEVSFLNVVIFHTLRSMSKGNLDKGKCVPVLN